MFSVKRSNLKHFIVQARLMEAETKRKTAKRKKL
jgi:hypothetical protein